MNHGPVSLGSQTKAKNNRIQDTSQVAWGQRMVLETSSNPLVIWKWHKRRTNFLVHQPCFFASWRPSFLIGGALYPPVNSLYWTIISNIIPKKITKVWLSRYRPSLYFDKLLREVWEETFQQICFGHQALLQPVLLASHIGCTKHRNTHWKYQISNIRPDPTITQAIEPKRPQNAWIQVAATDEELKDQSQRPEGIWTAVMDYGPWGVERKMPRIARNLVAWGYWKQAWFRYQNTQKHHVAMYQLMILWQSHKGGLCHFFWATAQHLSSPANRSKCFTWLWDVLPIDMCFSNRSFCQIYGVETVEMFQRFLIQTLISVNDCAMYYFVSLNNVNQRPFMHIQPKNYLHIKS